MNGGERQLRDIVTNACNYHNSPHVTGDPVMTQAVVCRVTVGCSVVQIVIDMNCPPTTVLHNDHMVLS